MNDQLIEETIEDLPKELRIEANGTAAIVVLSLATYGAVDLTRKGVAKANKMRNNWKAKKAAKKQAETDTPKQ